MTKKALGRRRLRSRCGTRAGALSGYRIFVEHDLPPAGNLRRRVLAALQHLDDISF
jgi:hypothetical protein